MNIEYQKPKEKESKYSKPKSLPAFGGLHPHRGPHAEVLNTKVGAAPAQARLQKVAVPIGERDIPGGWKVGADLVRDGAVALVVVYDLVCGFKMKNSICELVLWGHAHFVFVGI